MGRGRNPFVAASARRNFSRGRRELALAAAVGHENVPAGAALDDLYSLLADQNGWTDVIAPPVLRLVDAYFHGCHDEAAEQAWRVRMLLEAERFPHQVRRTLAGLAVMRAEQLLAKAYRVPMARVHARVGTEAETAKALHVFPWHLLG